MASSRDTLTGLFAPPQDTMHGAGGVLCAYSATADFLDQALGRFTGVSSASRRARGSVDWTLMLDPAHALDGLGDIGGLQLLRPRAFGAERREFTCMHAKVALLGFGSARAGEPTAFRLIVSTGNWTRESACNQIELIWILDVARDGAPAADRDELWAAAEFLRSLMSHYQSGGPLTARAELLLKRAQEAAGARSGAARRRFCTTLPPRAGASPGSLFTQVTRRWGGRGGRYDRVACGSGSFEQTRDPTEPARVLEDIRTSLATGSDPGIVVANLGADDQVMASTRAGSLGGWAVHRPADLAATRGGLERSLLHAKFLFLARKDGQHLSSPRLYLGSGNLSVAGFLEVPPTGNVEAGVLLEEEVADIDTERKLRSRLPIGTEYSRRELAEAECPAEACEEARGEAQPPAPVLAFVQRADPGALDVEWDTDVRPPGGVDVLWPAGCRQHLELGEARLCHDQAQVPRRLEIHWEGGSCKVPCLDSDGEFPRQPPPRLSFADWLDQLRAFPDSWHDPAADDDDVGADDPLCEAEVASPGTDRGVADGPRERDFPARTAMLLVETIAERNGDVAADAAADWLKALRHLLLEQRPVEQLDGWRELRVDFLRPLLSRQGFAPEWPDLAGYQTLIEEVSREWGLDHRCPLEVDG